LKDNTPVAVITGASRGFGRALLKEFVSHGWTTVPVIRDPLVAESLQTECGTDCLPLVGDVTDPMIEKRLTRHLTALPKVDLLINNAGIIIKERGLEAARTEDIRTHFDVHCLGALRCARATAPFLAKAAKPLIVNITSRWGSISMTAEGKGGLGSGLIYSYKIAKAALNMLTASLDHELRPTGIRVFAVHPGRLKTEVAPPDADTPPEEAARRLMKWLDSLDRDQPCHCYDLMNETIVQW
jgi:NAD(P)-dependent dehydrogenase (short-subunit alcohol dehydrogenase family)